MRIGRQLLSRMIPGLLKADGHLSDDWLLLSIDGELSCAEYEQVREHVRACWTCRARREQLEKTIKEIVEYEHALVAPDMPPSSGGKAILMARLNQLSGEMGRPPFLRRFVAQLTHAGHTLLRSRVAWGISAALAIALCLSIAFSRHTPVVSAEQLLHRASVSGARSLAAVSQPVIVQKVRIQLGARKLTRTIYRDPAHSRKAERADVTSTDAPAIAQEFQNSPLSWDDPLSPAVYGQWRSGLSAKKDVVTEMRGGLLQLDTTASSGPIAEASLTVRADDYHPIGEYFRMRDNTRIEVAELSYDVVGLSSIEPGVFTPLAPTEPVKLPSLASPFQPLHPVASDALEMAASELQARTVLHGLGADLGEQIIVHPALNGTIEVDGVANDEARKRQIAEALRSVPHTQVRVITLAQAATRPPERSLADAKSVSLIVATPPLLEEQLVRRFPDSDQRAEYVNQSLSLCQSTSARAWALNRLADRYTSRQTALLTLEAQHQLQSLLTDHIFALREDVSRLQNQLGQVLSSASNNAAANTATSATATAQFDDWRSRTHRIHSSIETTNEVVSVLLTGSSEGSDSTDKLQLRLRTTLTQLQAELQSLDQQVHKQL